MSENKGVVNPVSQLWVELKTRLAADEYEELRLNFLVAVVRYGQAVFTDGQIAEPLSEKAASIVASVASHGATAFTDGYDIGLKTGWDAAVATMQQQQEQTSCRESPVPSGSLTLSA